MSNKTETYVVIRRHVLTTNGLIIRICVSCSKLVDGEEMKTLCGRKRPNKLFVLEAEMSNCPECRAKAGLEGLTDLPEDGQRVVFLAETDNGRQILRGRYFEPSKVAPGEDLAWRIGSGSAKSVTRIIKVLAWHPAYGDQPE